MSQTGQSRRFGSVQVTSGLLLTADTSSSAGYGSEGPIRETCRQCRRDLGSSHRGPFMDIKRAIPRPQLRAVIRSFEERRAELGSAVLTWPVAARPHQILNIHLADPYRVRIDGGPANITPEISLVGPQTYRRAYVCLSGTVHVFNILFQPTDLNHCSEST